MQLRINAARARTYRTAQLIAVIVAFFVGLLVLTNREYMEPFGTAVGQLVLAVVVGVVGVSIWAMVVLSRPVRSPSPAARRLRHRLRRRDDLGGDPRRRCSAPGCG